MKLSISIPDHMAKEIKYMAKKSELSVSRLMQEAWVLSKAKFLQDSQDDLEARKRRAMAGFKKLQERLKDEYPGVDSVTLAKKAFENVD